MNLDRFFSPYKTPPLTNLGDSLRHWAEYQPDTVAFYMTDGEDEELRLTYAGLLRSAEAIAAELLDRDLAGQRALLLFPPGLDFVEAFFGCLLAGVTAVPAYPPRRNRNVGRIQAISDDAKARVALTVREVHNRVDNGILDDTPSLQKLDWLAVDDVDRSRADGFRGPQVKSADLAVLQYTSGSTGTPKGVMLSHANLMHNVTLIVHGFEPTREGIGLAWLPTYHDMGLVGGVLEPLFIGRPNVLMSPMAFLQKPLRWLCAVSRYRVSISGGPNFAYDLCTQKVTPEEMEGVDLSTWEVAFNGAEPIRPKTLKDFCEKFGPVGFRPQSFYPCYGMAETTLIVTGGSNAETPVFRVYDGKALDEHRVVPVLEGHENQRELVGCGHILPDETVAIVDPETRVRLPEHQVGEIWVRSPSVALGYWGKEEDTERAFGARLANDNSTNFLRTGDLGFLDKGELFVTGRLKDLIIVRGVNRYPQDIELTVEQADNRLQAVPSALLPSKSRGRNV